MSNGSILSPTVSPFFDLNIVAAGLLHDMALIQPSERSGFGYRRAARTVAGTIDRPVAELVAEGRLRDVPFIGAASERIVTELVRTGTSAIVEQAVASSPRKAEVEKRRRFRRAFLSRHAMRAILDAPLPPTLVSPAQYRGDLQMHSTWSDGAESIASLAEAALALGWTRIGMTDHSYGLPVARGMTMESARNQHEEIDRLNGELGGQVKVYKGVEANILPDGSLDLQLDERRWFDYVIASPHSLLRRETDQTSRMIAAVCQPGVAILGHPQGRVYNARGGVAADWDRVFAEAAARGVAVEIDGNWHRQDIDHELAARALDAGCLFALDSDAHGLPELPFTDYAIAHARLAQVPSERVVNCWEPRKFEDWLDERRAKGE
jgi:histidinol phosphatase-like PHP family hydrolase